METHVVFIMKLLSFWTIYHCCSIYECPDSTIPFRTRNF